MKFYQTFTVTGIGYFPVDMLRYNHCWPNSSVAVETLGQYTEQRTVELARYVRTTKAHDHPTVARWNSFGWTVSNITTRPLA